MAVEAAGMGSAGGRRTVGSDAGDGERGLWCPRAHYVTAGKDQRRQGEDRCAVFKARGVGGCMEEGR